MAIKKPIERRSFTFECMCLRGAYEQSKSWGEREKILDEARLLRLEIIDYMENRFKNEIVWELGTTKREIWKTTLTILENSIEDWEYDLSDQKAK